MLGNEVIKPSIGSFGGGMEGVDRKIWSPSYLQELKFEAHIRNMCRGGKEEGFSTVTNTLNRCNRKIKNKPGEIT